MPAMSTAEQLFDEALKLAPAEREALGYRITESALLGLELDEPSGDDAVLRRVNAYRAGTAASLALEEVVGRARSLIRASE